MRDPWKYTGPIFDAHTHIGTIENISKMIAIEDDYGVSKQIGIVHDEEGFRQAKEQYPGRFVYAKYLSLRDIAQYNVKPVLDEIVARLPCDFGLIFNHEDHICRHKFNTFFDQGICYVLA